MKNWKPWETLLTKDHDEKALIHQFANFSFAHPYPDSFERYDTMQHTPDARRPSAALHPEDKE